MKTQLLFITTCLLASFNTSAQFQINPDHMPAIGETYVYQQMVNPSFGAGDQGANVSWDFSNAVGVAEDYFYVSPSQGSSSADFPTANMLETNQNTYENYVLAESNSWSYVGHSIENVLRVTYSEPRAYMLTPFNFGETDTDSFESLYENLQVGQSFDRNGTSVITYDSYGTLVLPTGSFDNVARVKIEVEYSDALNGMPLVNYFDTIYLWFDMNTSSYIANYSISTANGIQLISQFIYMDNEVNVSDTHLEANVTVYPNPFNDQLTIEGDSKIQYLLMYGIDGALVKEYQPQVNLTTILLEDLPAGIYILEINTETGSQRKRIIKE